MAIWDIFRTDPRKRLERELHRKLEQAMLLQRSGKMPEYARVSAEAAALEQQLDALKPS